MIELTHFSFKYNDIETDILDDINLSISEGEFVLIAGPSGNGKTTLIRVLNGLIPQFYGGTLSGSARVFGKDIVTTPTRTLAKDVGIVFQNPDNQLCMNNVENEIVFGMENLGFPRAKMKQKLEYLIEFFGFKGMTKRDVSSLSGGEKQKLAIASVLAMEPRLLILDEPTSELDPKNADDIFTLLSKIRSEFHLTIILIEHRMDRVLNYVERVILLEQGRIIKDSSAEDVFLSQFPIEEVGITIPPYIDLIRKLRLSKLKSAFDPKNVTISNIPTVLSEFLSKLVMENPKWMENPIITDADRTPVIIRNDQTVGEGSGSQGLGEITAIELKNVTFGYQSNKMVLKNINLNVRKGEFVAIIGRNGSGKTTLLKQIMKLLQPNQGVVLLNGTEIRQKTIAEMSRDVGFLFQNPSVQFYQDTLAEEIQFVIDNYKKSGLDTDAAIHEILEQFGLLKYKNTYARYLSIGEQQKAALATILSVQPKILVLDEPMHGMDAKQRSIFFSYLKNYQAKGNTIIMVSHDIETIAKSADRIIIIDQGEIIADGATRDVLSSQPVFFTKIHLLLQRLIDKLNQEGGDGVKLNIEHKTELLKIHTSDELYHWILNLHSIDHHLSTSENQKGDQEMGGNRL